MSFAFLLAIAAGTGTPNVSIVHSGLIERYCSEASATKPDPAVVAEIDARVGDFEATWANDGPRLMAETVRLTGRPYDFSETQATLHGCPDIASMSEPLLLNVIRFTRAYLASPNPPPRPAGLGGVTPPEGPRAVLPMAEFAHILWHEVTHRYVHDIVQRLPGHTTPLLTKYAQESQTTRSHLHLLALDQMIQKRLGREDVFDQQEGTMRARGMQAYVRAIEIVRAEGAEKFVAELAR